MGKKRKPTIFRTTISVPFDLKERMDAAEADINWSAVACRAFEAKLAEVVGRKKEKNMQDVIQRLRASKHKSDDQNFKEGFELGQAWAKDDAKAEELDRLERLQGRSGHEWDTYFEASPSHDPSYVMAKEIIGPEELLSPRDFWEQVLHKMDDDWQHRIEDGSFIKGFVEGAIELWAEVKDQL